ncbi:hypothetical protein HZA45_01405 [Candidatus Peregrinibacteria bacterium]|nr:hypothetical protein [Candidatus Peregrinibacteria bacterium]
MELRWTIAKAGKPDDDYDFDVDCQLTETTERGTLTLSADEAPDALEHVLELGDGDTEFCRMLCELHDVHGCGWHIVADAFITPWTEPCAHGNCVIYRSKQGVVTCALLPHRSVSDMAEELWRGSLAIADETRSLFDALCVFGPWREYLLSFVCKLIIEGWEFRNANLACAE